MALITCPECKQKEISSFATTCPHCGYPINKKNLQPTVAYEEKVLTLRTIFKKFDKDFEDLVGPFKAEGWEVVSIEEEADYPFLLFRHFHVARIYYITLGRTYTYEGDRIVVGKTKKYDITKIKTEVDSWVCECGNRNIGGTRCTYCYKQRPKKK